MYLNTFRFAAATIAVLLLTGAADARPRHHARHGVGACDGFHRCRCGTTAARHFHLAYDHNGWNLKEARVWKRFPHTTFRVGVAGVVEHHVLAVVGGDTCAKATVSDDAGVYTRNVCNMTFVDPNGNTAYSARGKPQKMATAISQGTFGQ